MNKRTSEFSVVCVWPGTIVGDEEKQKEFVEFMQEEFSVRAVYLEEVITTPGRGGEGGRNDLFFAVHNDDVMKFAGPRLAYRIKWLDDAFANGMGEIWEEAPRLKKWYLGEVEDDPEDEGLREIVGRTTRAIRTTLLAVVDLHDDDSGDKVDDNQDYFDGSMQTAATLIAWVLSDFTEDSVSVQDIMHYIDGDLREIIDEVHDYSDKVERIHEVVVEIADRYYPEEHQELAKKILAEILEVDSSSEDDEEAA